VTDSGHAAEVEILASERFVAVGGALLAALAASSGSPSCAPAPSPRGWRR
jgi:hypothetical protein